MSSSASTPTPVPPAGDAVPVRVVLDPDRHRGPLDRRLFGTLVEHMGRCVYTGLYEPDHPSADGWGFRADVAELVRELGVTVARYPGGNFVSGYDWTDGIGPRDGRPRRLDLAWRSIETNEVGVDEFLPWAQRAGIAPMMAVNLGTAGVRDAAALVEYCNVDRGTAWSDLRRRHGQTTPHNVPMWCLGNEMDGPWQTGHKSAEEYGLLAAETAKAMRQVDPTVELVLCGSSHHDMPTFGYWESEVLERAGEQVDLLSMHAYYEEHNGDRASFLASGAGMNAFIDGVVATIDAVAARRRWRKRINISFDEWNVWYQSRFNGTSELALDVAGARIEDVYSTLDAVVVGDLLGSLINHADRVKVACLAQLVNVIAPIMSDPGGPTWRQATFHPFAAVAAVAHGNALVPTVEVPDVPTDRYGDVPGVAAAATHNTRTGAAAVLLTNRMSRPAAVEIRRGGFVDWTTTRVRHVAADDRGPRDPSSAAEVGLSPLVVHDLEGTTRLTLPPESWAVLEAAGRPPA